jgi:hypothetical protein
MHAHFFGRAASKTIGSMGMPKQQGGTTPACEAL